MSEKPINFCICSVFYPIKPIRNLGGHNIGSYTIHAGKYVPCIATNDMTKMEEGEVYAIETFATTGSGVVRELEPTSHYMKDPNHQFVDLKFKNYKKALNTINNLYDTLPFCDKWLHNEINNPKDVLDKLAQFVACLERRDAAAANTIYTQLSTTAWTNHKDWVKNLKMVTTLIRR